MANFIFNIARGKIGYYSELPGANDALIVVPLETSGLESDAALKDYDTLAAVLAGTTNEQATMGRKTLSGVSSVVDDTGDKRTVDATDVTWTAPTGNAVSKLIVCYDADTTSGTDTDIVPLMAWDWVQTPAGADLTAIFNASGLWVSA